MTRLRFPPRLVALLVTAAVATFAARGHLPGRSQPAPIPGSATVARVVDGDTIVVRAGSRDEKVRLVGIDTPESVKPRTPVQCFAKEASARTTALLPSGTRVRLVRDVEARDRYGRLLAYVYRDHDGLFVNLALAQEGYAGTLTIPPNVAHAAELLAATRAARDAGRGLWARCGGPHEVAP
jgi:micrococcal nuclease